MTSSDTPARSLHGACLCGGVRYRAEDRFRYAMYCHCSLCRRTTGSAFKSLAGLPREAIAITQGEDLIQTYGPLDWHNVNCRVCGTMLYAVVREGTFVHLSLGTLADAPAIRPTMHIFVGSKAPWFEIADDLPQHDGFPPI